MLSMVARLAGWARRTTASFTDSGSAGIADSLPLADGEPIYRLRRWPTLPGPMRTATVLRLLSVMSTRPVNRAWMLRHSGLQSETVDQLISRLERDGALDAVDPSGYGPTRAPD